MTISASSLMTAIRALHAETQRIAGERETAADPDLSHLDEELHAYSKALTELKALYLEKQQRAGNLPSYEDLVG